MVGGGKDREEMRLIDADDFRRILREIQTDAEHFDNEQRRNDIGSIMALLDKQPTAFDKEKVVEQLKETRKTALNKVKMPIMIVCKHDLQEFADICFEESIDIVKKGGVE